MKICFFAASSYPTLVGTPDAVVGGAEVQQKFIATYLVQQGHEVSFVVRDHGQNDIEVIDEIKIYKAYKLSAGIPFLRFFHPRFTGAWKALKKTGADVYYQRCAGMETGLLALFCMVNRKKFVFASASDSDFKFSEIITSSIRDKYFYRFGLKRANAIVTQTGTQNKLLNDNFGLNSLVIPNCWVSDETVGELAGRNGYVLWVSTMRSLKRPELFVELAESMPHVKFVMVGGVASGEQGLYDDISEKANALSNFTFVGFVPFAEVGQYFDGASIVVNTSTIEGFPNAFLQAWQRSVPVLSYFDPDGIVGRENVGIIVDSKEGMLKGLSNLLEDDDVYASYQMRAKSYFNNNHRIEAIGTHYEKLFNGL